MIKAIASVTALASVFLGCTQAQAVVLSMGQSAQIDFTATTATPPFDFVTFSLMFAASNPFGPDEALSYKTTDGKNTTLVDNPSFLSGSSVYTSGLFGQLTQNAIVPFSLATALSTQSFSLLVTANTGSFDLIGATADFEHILTSGPSQLGVVGTFAPVPEPSTWALMLIGLAGLGFAGYRRTSKAASITA